MIYTQIHIVFLETILTVWRVLWVRMMYTSGTHSISFIRAIVFIFVLCTVGQYDVYPRYT